MSLSLAKKMHLSTLKRCLLSRKSSVLFSLHLKFLQLTWKVQISSSHTRSFSTLAPGTRNRHTGHRNYEGFNKCKLSFRDVFTSLSYKKKYPASEVVNKITNCASLRGVLVSFSICILNKNCHHNIYLIQLKYFNITNLQTISPFYITVYEQKGSRVWSNSK